MRVHMCMCVHAWDVHVCVHVWDVNVLGCVWFVCVRMCIVVCVRACVCVWQAESVRLRVPTGKARQPGSRSDDHSETRQWCQQSPPFLSGAPRVGGTDVNPHVRPSLALLGGQEQRPSPLCSAFLQETTASQH